MVRDSEQLTLVKTQTHEAQQPLVIEYADLVDTIQLSVARQIDIPGALEAQSLEEVLATKTGEEKEKIICEIGLHFDEALMHFVISAMIGRRKRSIVIIADPNDGVGDGYLPWEESLAQRIAEAEDNGILTGVDVRVERVSKIIEMAPELGNRACEQTLELMAS